MLEELPPRTFGSNTAPRTYFVMLSVFIMEETRK
jgi:hypothetical protein